MEIVERKTERQRERENTYTTERRRSKNVGKTEPTELCRKLEREV